MLDFVVHSGESIAPEDTTAGCRPRTRGPGGGSAARGDGDADGRRPAHTERRPLPFIGHRTSTRSFVLVAGLAIAGLVAGCGGSEQNAGEPHGDFPVSVSSSFPATQSLAQRTSFTVSVRNVGKRVIPDIAVTVLNPRYGAAAQAFGTLLRPSGSGQPILASRSRPVWIINRAPGPCRFSCRSRGPGGAATAYSNTWALGRLKPGHTAVFRWRLTAVQAGAYTVEYEVAAGLNGYAKAVLTDRTPARGHFDVHISSTPPSVTVQPDGQVTSRT